MLNGKNINLKYSAIIMVLLHSVKKYGFKEIGRQREAKFIAGKAHDIVIMDILATEFESPFVKRFFE